jgi:hypothetical protein
MTRAVPLSILVVALLVLPAAPMGVGLTVSAVEAIHAPHIVTASVPAAGAFNAATNFEDLHLDGWTASAGKATISTSVEYQGEPSLQSTAGAKVAQVDLSSRGFKTGDAALSFQALVNHGAGGTGFVGLAAKGVPVAVVGVSGGSVWAGASPSTATSVATIPSGTAQPSGWVDLMVSLTATNPTAPSTAPWLMDVYADRTDIAAATNISVSGAGNYTGGLLETTSGTLYYTNLYFTTYQIPVTIPGYNNMDGYGQGSGLLVSLLPAFTTLSANITIDNWSVPQVGILGTQINAMNRGGTTVSTCIGFYQLGFDLDPGGRIAPWYVPGVNCVATYFGTNSTRTGGGFVTPKDSHLTLSITDNYPNRTLTFQIVDLSVTGANRYSNATIAYKGTEFYGTYTQIEWQPCCSTYPISSYFYNGTFSHLRISGGTLTTPMLLGASYMIPFALDVPPSWNYGYYNATTAGYSQVG